MHICHVSASIPCFLYWIQGAVRIHKRTAFQRTESDDIVAHLSCRIKNGDGITSSGYRPAALCGQLCKLPSQILVLLLCHLIDLMDGRAG